jgi:hypothetical protein
VALASWRARRRSVILSKLKRLRWGAPGSRGECSQMTEAD